MSEQRVEPPKAEVRGYRGSWTVHVGPAWVTSTTRKGDADAIVKFLNKDHCRMARWALIVARAPAVKLPNDCMRIYSEFEELGICAHAAYGSEAS